MEKNKIEELIEQGFSTHKLAKHFNISQTNIRYWLKKFSLVTTGKQFSKKEMFGTKAICSKHGLTEYAKNGRRCSKCAIESVNKIRRNNKIKGIGYKGGCCEKCGYDKCIAALEFHHLDPLQKDPNGLGNRSWERLKEEYDKCILLCANCHREEHYKGV